MNVEAVLSSGWISGSGEFVDEFERSLASYTGASEAVVVNSGTMALEIALQAIGVQPGDEIVLPALTFGATASAVVSLGCVPVFADITPETWTLDPACVRSKLTARTRAIVAVDLLGHPYDADSLSALGLPVIEDAAQAFGAQFRGRMAGTLGTIGTFSFHANKPISTGEGGCIVTSDGALAKRCRTIAHHGLTPGERYDHTTHGRNGRMTNIAAAIGVAQLRDIGELMARRRRIGALYDAGIADLPVTRRPVASWATESLWLYTVTSSRRDVLVAGMQEAEIDVRAIWPPLPFVRAFSRWRVGDYPVSERVSATALWLPTWADLTQSAVDEVVGLLARLLL